MTALADRVKESTTTTGTGSLTLAGAVAQFESFNTAFGTANPFYYVITDANGTDWEVGTGELSNATTLVRTTVHQSSNADAKINLSAGTHTVFCSAPAVFLSDRASKTGKLSQFAATTSAELAGVISDETGSGALVFATSPSLTTPNIGAATATSVNGTTIPSSKTLVITTDKLSALAATTSAELAGVISDETGTGSLVFATSPALTTPNLGTPSAGTLTNCTGLPVGSVSGLGTGVGTALAVNTGSAGAFVVNGGALGTPSSGTLTNATNLPLSTGVTGTLPVANGGTGQTSFTDGQLLIGNSTGNTLSKATLTAGSGISITNGSGAITIAASGGSSGTVTSVSQTFTGGLVSVSGSPVTSSGTLALTVAGTSGGVPYFSSASTWASSAALTANALMVGGGAGAAPSTVTTGTGVVTALGVNTGSSGAFVVNGGDLGTPSGGTVTNLTGTASININGTVGATTPTTGAFTTVTSTSASGILTRAAATQDGVELIGRAGGTTSLKVSLTPGTLTASRTLTLPDNSGTVLTSGAAVTVAQGGTGQTTYTDGQLLIGNTSGNTLTKATLTGTSNQVTVTNGNGSITLSTPQSINTSASVQFGSFGVGTAASGTSGEIRATNNVTAYYSSDARLKENVRDIPDALSAAMAIGGKLFDWSDAYIKSRGGEDGYFVRKADFGVIAQDVLAVFPQAVRERDDGMLAVDYEKLCALAFAAIKELKNELDALKVRYGP
jgi:hypothetical protein